MTTPFYSDKSAVGGGIQARAGIGLESVVGVYELATALLEADVIHMVKIPAGATLLDLSLIVDDLDEATSLTLSVGYTGALTAFINASTVGQAGGVARAAAGIPHLFAAEDTIQVSATAVSGSETATGTLTLIALYTMDP